MMKRLYFFMVMVFFVLIICFPAYCGTDASDSQEQIGWDIFGKKGGWFHAYVTAGGMYSDNIYNRNIEKDSDFITLITPGISLTTSGGKHRTQKIFTYRDTPGGITVSRFDKPSSRRFNAYVFYEPEFEIYSDNSNLNTTNQQFEGGLRYKLRGGLSIELNDRFMDTYDPYSESLTILEEKNKYKTNLASIALAYRFSDKLSLKLDYGNFLVDYEEERNEGLNRTDHTATGYVFFQVRPKTAVFTGYEFTQTDYKINESSNKTEDRIYGGFQWDITEKSRGRIKVGYSDTDFDDPFIENVDGYIYEIQLQQNFTKKTSLSLRAYRKREESNLEIYDYILTHRFHASYLQRITRKVAIGLKFWYAHESYKGEVNFGGESIKRTDDLYYLNPFIRYRFTDWVSMGLEYIYEKRDSTIELWSFETNNFLISLTLGM